MGSYEIKCDKCGSHNVEKMMAVKPTPPKIPVVKMSDVVRGKVPQTSNIVNAVMTYSTYKLRCNNCGYTTDEFTENDQLGVVV